MSARKRSERSRERVWVARVHSAQAAARPERRLTPTEPSDPHPTGLRPATFSHWEKDQVLKLAACDRTALTIRSGYSRLAAFVKRMTVQPIASSSV